jgi:hypothetical protein
VWQRWQGWQLWRRCGKQTSGWGGGGHCPGGTVGDLAWQEVQVLLTASGTRPDSRKVRIVRNWAAFAAFLSAWRTALAVRADRQPGLPAAHLPVASQPILPAGEGAM